MINKFQKWLNKAHLLHMPIIIMHNCGEGEITSDMMGGQTKKSFCK